MGKEEFLSPDIVCCYSSLNPKTLETLKAYAQTAVYEDTSASPFAYADAIERHWTGERDLILIEQDMGIDADTISSFTECPEPWCVFEYTASYVFEKLRYSLGCTKFSAELQRKVPFSEMRRRSRKPAWNAMDGLIWFVLYQANGFDSHIHGETNHFHDYGYAVTNVITENSNGFVFLYDEAGTFIGKMEALSPAQLDHNGQDKISRKLGIRDCWDHEAAKLREQYK